jgi:hypothetical protein
MTGPAQQTGKLKSNSSSTASVRIRQQPSLQASFVEKPAGTVVTILGKTSQADGNGKLWYQVVTADATKGWVYFETNSRQVRVYEDGIALYMNVYNKQTSKTELNRAPTTKLVPSQPTLWETYLATQAGRTYQAKFERRGKTELQITNSNTGQTLEPAESGFNSSGFEYQRG